MYLQEVARGELEGGYCVNRYYSRTEASHRCRSCCRRWESVPPRARWMQHRDLRAAQSRDNAGDKTAKAER
jgi:hypothetical protein